MSEENFMKKIIALTGSVKGIKTQIALKHTLSYISKHNPTMETELFQIGDFNLEFSDGRPISDYNLDTQFVINKILEADAIIIATPTYQTSIPGALKNIFDLLPMNALDTKIAGIIVTAASPMYFLMAEQQLKPILSYMGAHVINKYVYIQDCDFTNNVITNPDITQRLCTLALDTLDGLGHMDLQKKYSDDRKNIQKTL